VRVFEVSSGRLVKELAHLGRVRHVQFAKDNDFLLSTADDGVKLWDIQHTFKQFNIGELKHESVQEFTDLIDRSATFSECGDLVIVNSQYKNSEKNHIKI